MGAFSGLKIYFCMVCRPNDQKVVFIHGFIHTFLSIIHG
jgi:hypothetical protein